MKLTAYFSNFYKYRGLLAELVKRDIKVRYRRSVLGMLWSVLNPLLTMLVMSFVFSNLFKNNLANFPVYLISGTLVFGFFNEGSNQAMMSILDNRMLIQKVYIPKYILPLSRVTAGLVNMLFSLIALILVLIFTGTSVSPTFVLMPVLFVYVYLFTFGVGLLLSSAAVFFRDMIHLYGVIITAWTYFTPLFYPIEILPEAGQYAINFNPLYQYVTYFRYAVWSQQWPDLMMNVKCIACSLIALLLGLFVFYKKQYKFAQSL